MYFQFSKLYKIPVKRSQSHGTGTRPGGWESLPYVTLSWITLKVSRVIWIAPLTIMPTWIYTQLINFGNRGRDNCFGNIFVVSIFYLHLQFTVNNAFIFLIKASLTKQGLIETWIHVCIRGNITNLASLLINCLYQNFIFVKTVSETPGILVNTWVTSEIKLTLFRKMPKKTCPLKPQGSRWNRN